MSSWSYGPHSLSKYSITEILVLPSLNIHKILVDISRQFHASFFLDTIGNLSILNDCESLNLDIVYISSIRKFLRELKNIQTRNYKDILVVIDSMAFLSDINVPVYNQVYSLISSLCLRSQCTVICTNHYRKANRNFFGPRLGEIWSRMPTHRIFYKFKKDKIVYELEM